MIALAVGTAGATGCFLSKGEETSSSPDEVVTGANGSVLLKSTLVLDAGCIATKVGPKHLLVSARCVAGNEKIAKGKTLGFKTANVATTTEEEKTVLAPADAGSGTKPRDAGATDAAASSDAGTTKSDAGSQTPSTTGDGRSVTISEVSIHPSFEAKCTGANANACGFSTLEAADAPDVALLLLDADLESVPTVPVDLDPVGQVDPVLVLGSGCEIVGAETGGSLGTKRTIAVAPKVANHAGSPYAEEPQKIGTLSASYFVTAGPGWKKTELGLCRSDFGAPVFRAGVGAVAGITSGFTMYGTDTFVPVTVHHTRLDAQSRFKIGNWLESQGVEILHSCSEKAGGCEKHEYDGGAPIPPTAGPGGGTTAPGDGGNAGDAIAPEADGGPTEGELEGDAGQAGPTNPSPTGGQEEQLADQGPPEDDYSGGEDDGDYADAAAPRKKKKAEESGCSAAPGPMPAGETGLVLGVGLAVMAIGRRRRHA